MLNLWKYYSRLLKANGYFLRTLSQEYKHLLLALPFVNNHEIKIKDADLLI